MSRSSLIFSLFWYNCDVQIRVMEWDLTERKTPPFSQPNLISPATENHPTPKLTISKKVFAHLFHAEFISIHPLLMQYAITLTDAAENKDETCFRDPSMTHPMKNASKLSRERPQENQKLQVKVRLNQSTLGLLQMYSLLTLRLMWRSLWIRLRWNCFLKWR